MLTVKLMGGIGNQMFQVAAAYGVSRENDDELLLSTYGWDSLSGKHPDNYMDNIFSEFIWTDKELMYHIVRESLDINIKYKGHIKLMGYFQNPAYFDKYRADLKRLFFKGRTLDFTNYISLHVRRGDYLRLKKHPVVTKEYIERAIKEVDKKGNFERILLFSDDVDWCIENIKDERLVNADTGDDAENIFIMSSCGANIISNSTYSWWGAYLNDNAKTVIAPKDWYVGQMSKLQIFNMI